MSAIILVFTIIILMFTEIRFIDPWFWRSGKSDKPGSTIFAALLMIIIGVLVQFVFSVNWAFSAIFLAFMLRIGLFDYMYVLVYRKPWNYLGENPTDQWKYKMGFMRYPTEAFCILVGIMQYLYFDCSIYCDADISILFDLPRFSTPW